MASKAKNIANRGNAHNSTGPRTEAGKQASKYNRTRHGLAGKQIVIQNEDPAAYEALRNDLIHAYDPANAAELALVEEIAQNFWRIQRGRALEAEAFKMYSAGADPIIGFQTGRNEFDNIRRYMGAIERAYHRALTQLALEQKERRKREAQAPSQQPIVIKPPRPRRPADTPQPFLVPEACPGSLPFDSAQPPGH